MYDHASTAVPENEGPRYGWLYLTNIEVAVAICVPVFMFGAMLGQSLTAQSLCVALLVSGGILTIVSGISSYVGTKTRLSTALLAKKSFGQQGVKVVWLVLAISCFGWFGVQTEMFATAFLTLAKQYAPSLMLNKTVVVLVSGLLMSSTAVLGIKAVGKLAQVAIPLLLGVMVYALINAIQQNGWNPWSDFVPTKPMAMGAVIAAVVGGYSVGAIIMPDIKRYAKNVPHAVIAAGLSLGIFYPLLLLLTAITSVLTAQPDFMSLLGSMGFGWLTLVILMLATWTTNDVNLYSASLSITPLLPNLSRSTITLVCGILGTFLATFGLFEHLITLFMMLGVLTMPLFAIYIVDYMQNNDNTLRDYNLFALVAWIVASLFGILTTPSEQWGLGLLSFTTVSGLDSMLAALVVYPSLKFLRL